MVLVLEATMESEFKNLLDKSYSWIHRLTPRRLTIELSGLPGLDCRACYHPSCLRGDDSCMRQITVDEVFEAAGRMLERTFSRTGA